MQKYTNVVQDTSGNILSGVTVSVYATGTTNLSTIFSTNAGFAKTNPFTNDTDGSLEFFAANGRYDVTFTKTGYTFDAPSTADILLEDVAMAGTVLNSPVLSGTITGTYTLGGTPTVSAGIVLSTGSTTARSLALRFSETVNVKDYGAVGNGVADDTAAVTAAVTAAAGKRLYFPTGTYMISSIVCSSSILILGDGHTSVIKQLASTVAHMVTVSGTSTRVTVQNITFDGNTANQAANSTNRSLYLASTGTSTAPSSLEVSGCTFINGNYADIYVFTDSILSTLDYLTVESCTFLGGSDGDNTANGDPRYISIVRPIIYRITGNTFNFKAAPTGFGRVAIISFQTGVVTDWAHGTITNNVITYCGKHTDGGSGNLAAISIYSYGECVIISNNVLISSWGGAISAKFDSEQLVISGNTIRGIYSLHGNPNTGGTISVDASVNTSTRGIISITGNSIADVFYNGIVLNGVNSTSTLYGDTVAVTGNTLETATVTANVAISVNNLIDVTITGNVVNGFAAGVHLQNARKSAVISANTVRLATVYAINIATSNTLALLTITGNYVEDATTRGIYLGSSGGGLVACNTVTNAGTTVGIYVLDNTAVMLIANNQVQASTPFFTSGTVTGLQVTGNSFSTTITRLVTVATGVVTAYLDWHTVDTEAAAATDDLDTINGGVDGDIKTFRAANSARDVVFKDGTGNMKLTGDFTLNNVEDTITLRYMAGTWYELSRSDNGA
jgi:hypothetical protein